jgi:hypothetical protein
VGVSLLVRYFFSINICKNQHSHLKRLMKNSVENTTFRKTRHKANRSSGRQYTGGRGGTRGCRVGTRGCWRVLSPHGDVYGQEEAIEQLRLLLLSTPSQAIILSAPNNAGKTHVLGSALSKHTTVVFVSLSRFPLTTVSNLVQTVTAQLGIKKLSMRKMLTDLLPFAGRELLMKERQTVEDLEEPKRARPTKHQCLCSLVSSMAHSSKKIGTPFARVARPFRYGCYVRPVLKYLTKGTKISTDYCPTGLYGPVCVHHHTEAPPRPRHLHSHQSACG